MLHPIVDKYYERDPQYIRSSAFVHEKGLVSNEKTPSRTNSPAVGTTGNSAKPPGDISEARGLSPVLVHRSAATAT